MKAEGVAGGSSALLLPSAWSGTAVGEGGGAVAAPASAGPAPSLCPGLVGCLRLRRQLRLAAKMVAISHTFPHTSPKWENEPLMIPIGYNVWEMYGKSLGFQPPMALVRSDSIAPADVGLQA